MARIQINELPLVEKLTPEQEEEILGAGRATVRPTLESLESREMMDAALGGALTTGIFAQASAKAHVRVLEIDVAAKPIEHMKELTSHPLTQQSLTPSTEAHALRRSILPTEQPFSQATPEVRQANHEHIGRLEKLSTHENEARAERAPRMKLAEEQTAPLSQSQSSQTQDLRAIDLARHVRIGRDEGVSAQAAAPAAESVDRVMGDVHARRILDGRFLESTAHEQVQVQEASPEAARIHLAQADELRKAK